MKTNVGLPRSASELLAMFELDDRRPRVRIILARTHDDDKWVVSSQCAYEGEDAIKAMGRSIVGDDEPRWAGSWNQGHYFHDLEEARDYFLERCRKRS